MDYATVSQVALSLPEVTEAPHHHFGSFRVRGKIFMTVPPAQSHLHLFVPELIREQAIELYPQFVEPLLWGNKVAGIRVTLASVKAAQDGETVKQLILDAWRHKSAGKIANTKPTKPRTVNATLSPSVGYSGTPLAKKLSIKPGTYLLPINPPADYAALLAPLPANVVIETKVSAKTDIAHLFITEKAVLAKQLQALRKQLNLAAALWVSWPKKAAKLPTTVTEDVIRELALPLGFVDIKVCAIDATWSGLKLVVRKELR